MGDVLLEEGQIWLYIFVVLLLALSSIQGVTADTSDSTSVNLTIGNTAPNIDYVATVGAQDAVAAGNVEIHINFTANDMDGLGDLVNASAMVRLIGGVTDSPGYNERYSLCTAASWNDSAINYTCVVVLWYFDAPGTWEINVTINDTGGVKVEDQSGSVVLNPLTAMDLEDNNITFGNISGGQTVGASNSPMEVLNRGNVNATTFTMNATDLLSPTGIIGAGNFTMNENDSAVGNATRLGNETYAILSWGNITVGNDTREEIYTYVAIPSGLPKENYASRRNWELTLA